MQVLKFLDSIGINGLIKTNWNQVYSKTDIFLVCKKAQVKFDALAAQVQFEKQKNFELRNSI